MRVSIVYVIFFLLLLYGFACTSHQVPRDDNILLIIVDTLRADHLGCYGGREGISPNIDRLAHEGVQFMNAHTTAPWTQPAVSSIVTSLYPSRHGVTKIFGLLSQEHITLAEILKKHEYTTGGIVSHSLLESKYGYAQGFEYFNSENAWGHDVITSAKVTYDGIRWLDQNKSKKFFLMLHYFDPHYTYKDHPEFNYIQGYNGKLNPGEDIRTLRKKMNELTNKDIMFLVDHYDEEISYVDMHLGNLFDYLEREGLKDNTIIIFTADHGEEFMTHGWIGHTRTLYQELIHVPLIIKDPRQFSPRKVDANVSILDIMPTLFDLLNIRDKSTAYDGQSLVPYLKSGDSENAGSPVFFEVSFGDTEEEDIIKKQKIAFKKGIRQDHWKLIYDELKNEWEMYDTLEDPVESHNIIEQHPGIRNKLEKSLRTWASTLHQDKIPSRNKQYIKPSRDEIENMKSLGYIQ